MLHHLLFHNPASHPDRTILDFIHAVGQHGRDRRNLKRLDPSQIPDIPEVVLDAHDIRVYYGSLLIGLGPEFAVSLLRQDLPDYDRTFSVLASSTPGAAVIRKVLHFNGKPHSRHLRLPLSLLPLPGTEVIPTKRNDISPDALARYLGRRVTDDGKTLLELAFQVAPVELDGRKISAKRRHGELPLTPLPEEILWQHRLRVVENCLYIIMGTEEIVRVIGCHPDVLVLGIAGARCNPRVSAIPGNYNGVPQRNAASRLEIPLASLEPWLLQRQADAGPTLA